MAVFIVTYCLSGGHSFRRTLEGENAEAVEQRISEEVRTSSEKWLSFPDSSSEGPATARFRIQVEHIVGFEIRPRGEE